MASITIIVNGQEQMLEAAPDMPLLWALRDILGLTGAKYSCGAGHCGTCTVHVDGKARRACITAVADVAGKQVTTIEGLAGAGRHPVQGAWIAERVSQCGYCQPGQIMTAVALLKATPTPSDDEIDAAMSDTLCRCGTYQRIRRAIHRAAGNRQSATAGGA